MHYYVQRIRDCAKLRRLEVLATISLRRLSPKIIFCCVSCSLCVMESNVDRVFAPFVIRGITLDMVYSSYFLWTHSTRWFCLQWVIVLRLIDQRAHARLNQYLLNKLCFFFFWFWCFNISTFQQYCLNLYPSKIPFFFFGVCWWK